MYIPRKNGFFRGMHIVHKINFEVFCKNFIFNLGKNIFEDFCKILKSTFLKVENSSLNQNPIHELEITFVVKTQFCQFQEFRGLPTSKFRRWVYRALFNVIVSWLLVNYNDIIKIFILTISETRVRTTPSWSDLIWRRTLYPFGRWHLLIFLMSKTL